MTAFNWHTTGAFTPYIDTIQPILKKLALSMADSPDGTKRPIDLSFFGELRDGEGMIGYEYLHGTNASEIPPFAPPKFTMDTLHNLVSNESQVPFLFVVFAGLHQLF